ncbi:hypothetical protein, partial [Mesorhizobium sp.]|uniref:hypothetical protein n=1 Tax=Mesorhizobium sp. TaxID=1871066 RepID=UPI00260010EF
TKIPVTIYIDDDQEIEAIKLKPLSAKMATPSGSATTLGTSTATAKATYDSRTNATDAEADVTYDL